MISMQAKMLRAVDGYLGTFLYFLFWFLRPVLKNDSDNRNVLVIKLWAIGESVLVLPFAKALKEKGFNVTVMCTKQNVAVFEKQPFIDSVIVFDFASPFDALAALLTLRKHSFSVAIDSDPYMKFSAVLSVLSGASQRFGLENRRLLYTTSVRINENEHAVLVFYRIFNALSHFPPPKSLVPLHAESAKLKVATKSVAIHAGSADTSLMRRWSEKSFARVCDHFGSRGWTVYLVGSASEGRINGRIRSLCESGKIIDLSGKLTISQLAWLFSRVGIVIANDAGPMHIAAAMGAPTVGLFGPNLPQRFGPYGKNCIGVRKDAGPPCILPFRARFPECEHDHMKDLAVEDVLEAAEKLLRA